VVFAVILLLAVVIGIGVLYNTGRLTLDKTRLQNTTDSAAYSAGVLLARSYNFSAYANRAMVANQVVIGQMVGLRSWSTYYCLAYHDECGDKSSFHRDLPSSIGEMVSKVVPYDFLWPAYKAVSQASFVANDRILGIVPDKTIGFLANKIIYGLSEASHLYHKAVEADLLAAAGGTGLIPAVVKANYPHLAGSDRPHLDAVGQGIWLAGLAQVNAYTKLYGTNQPYTAQSKHMAMFATLVHNALDQWTQNRMTSGGMSTSESLPYPMFNSQGLYQGLMECKEPQWISLWVNYHGSTQWQWQGNDPQWLANDHAHIYGFNLLFFPNLDPFDPFPPCLPIFPLPVETDPSIYFNPTTLSKAQAEFSHDASQDVGFSGAYYGLEPYEDVSGKNLSSTRTPALTLVLVRDHQSIQTTQNLGVDQGAQKVGIGSTNRLNLPSGEAGGKVAAESSVEVHFVRPGGAGEQRLLGGEIEYANLFSPYWQAHLVPTPTAVTIAAQAGQGGKP
jgi:hypothetical protein